MRPQLFRFLRSSKTSRFQLRTALVEQLENRSLLASDTLRLPATVEADLPQVDIGEIAVEHDSDAVQSQKNLAAKGLATQSTAANLLPKGYSLSGQTAEDALAAYLQSGPATALKSDVALQAAWSDYDTRATRFSGLDSRGVALLRSVSEAPASIQNQMFGSDLVASSEVPVPGQLSNEVLAGSFNPLTAFAPVVAKPSQPPIAIGWFCNAAGESAGPSITSAEGEDPDQGANGEVTIPAVPFPQLELTNSTDSIALYSPSVQSSGRVVNTQGVFDENTTADSDLTLPGVNSVHIVNTLWIDADHWSVTETLVMSFNITVNVPFTPDEDEGDASGSSDSSDSTGEPSHLTTTTTVDSITLNRTGFVILVFHAEKGMSASPTAGVKWNVSLNFSDAIKLTLSSAGGSTVVPNPAFVDQGSGGDGTEGGSGGTDESGGDDGYMGDGGTQEQEPKLPKDYQGTSSWNSTITLSLKVFGTINFSCTPQLVLATAPATGTVVQQVIGYSDNIHAKLNLILGGGWAATSGSGNLNGTSPVTEPSELNTALTNGNMPIGGGDGNVSVPADGDLGISAGQAIGDWDDTPGDWSPFDRPTGNGHQFGSSGGFNTSIGTGSNSGLAFAAVAQGEELIDFTGSLNSGFKNSFDDDFEDKQILVYSDGGQDETSIWMSTLVVGRNVSPKVAANVGMNKTYGFTIDEDGAADVTPSSGEDAAGASGSDQGINFDLLTVETASLTPALYGGRVLRRETWVDNKGGAGTSSGEVSAEAKVGMPDKGKLKLKWDGSSFEYQKTTIHSDLYQPLAGYMSIDAGLWTSVQDFSLSIQTTYRSGGDTEDTVNGSGNAAPSGTATSKTEQTIAYSSHWVYNYEATDDWSNNQFPLWFVSYTKETIDRTATFNQTITAIGSYTAGNAPTDLQISKSGDTKVQVSGDAFWGNWQFNPGSAPFYFLTDRVDIASGMETHSGLLDGNYFNNVYGPIEQRTGFEKWLDGTTDVYSTEGLPQDVGITQEPPELSITAVPTTFLSFIAGHRGDVIDQGINFAAGFADNVTFNASYLWRDKILGFDTIDYDSTAYGAGSTFATVVQLPGLVKALPGAVKAGVQGVKNIAKAFNSFDDAGRCGNIFTKLWQGGCFVAGTLVTVSDMPMTQEFENALWTDDFCVDDFGLELSPVATAERLLIPIEEVPLGARVPTKNPRVWEVDDSLPEPDQESWAKISMTMFRTDGGIVDAELIRPKWWVKQHGLDESKLLPMTIEELQVHGLAQVTEVSGCPTIAHGDGSVVTGRFLTREVNVIVRAEIIGPDDEVEIIEGTPVHPVWSVDRQDWVPLGQLEEGEQLLAADGVAVVASLVSMTVALTVYNVEVLGEHVYQCGDIGLLVHNTYPEWLTKALDAARAGCRGDCEIASELLRRAIPGGMKVRFAGDRLLHEAYKHGDEIYDITAGQYVRPGLLTAENIAEAGLTQALNSGVFSLDEHAKFMDLVRKALQ